MFTWSYVPATAFEFAPAPSCWLNSKLLHHCIALHHWILSTAQLCSLNDSQSKIENIWVLCPKKVTSPFTYTISRLIWTEHSCLFAALLFDYINPLHCRKTKAKTKKGPTAAAMLPSPPSSSAATSFFDSTFSVFLHSTFVKTVLTRPLSYNRFLLPGHHQTIMISKSSTFLISRISLALSLPWRALSWTWGNNSDTEN